MKMEKKMIDTCFAGAGAGWFGWFDFLEGGKCKYTEIETKHACLNKLPPFCFLFDSLFMCRVMSSFGFNVFLIFKMRSAKNQTQNRE